VNSRQLRNWLAKQGCTFEVKRSGPGHLVVRRGKANGSKQLGTGLINKIKKDLGLK
jgi:mRNA interferase HicA